MDRASTLETKGGEFESGLEFFLHSYQIH